MFTAVAAGPAIEPVTLSEARGHLRVDHSDDDLLIMNLIVAAREHIEGTSTRRALITQTRDYWLPHFSGSMEIPYPPLQSVTSVKYIDAAGAEQTLDSSVYAVVSDDIPGRVELAYGESWPTVRRESNAVAIRFVAGYGAARGDVPATIRQGLLLLVGHLYENRELVAPVQLHTIPMGIKALLAPYRCW